MSGEKLSDNLMFSLSSAGWTKNRRDIGYAVRCAKEFRNEYRIFPEWIRFIGHFGGMVLRDFAAGRGRMVLNFNPLDWLGEADYFMEFSELCGEQILPVGTVEEMKTAFAVGASGNVYHLGPQTMRWKNVFHAMDQIMHGRLSGEVLD